jgi:hypothetical protein
MELRGFVMWWGIDKIFQIEDFRFQIERQRRRTLTAPSAERNALRAGSVPRAHALG